MFRKIIVLLGLLTITFSFMAQKVFAQQKAGVIGVWYNEERDARIKVYKAKNQKFYGKIVWLKNPTYADGTKKVDKKNKKEELRSRPLMGLLILKGFEQEDAQHWSDGSIYDPKSGNTYSCNITEVNHNKLKIRGYIGISLFGRTTYWKRYK